MDVINPRKSWLPKSFEFLSGFPEEKRKKRLIVVVQAFADESEDTEYFAMSSVVAKASSWASFSDEWRACLKKSPWLPYFKMKDAAGRSGTFHKFSVEQRDQRLGEFADIINRHVKMVTYSIIDLAAFKETWKKALDRPRNQPYFWPYQNTIMAICFALMDIGVRERFEMIFDEHVIFGPRARQWYPVIRAVMKEREPKSYGVMPVEPMFKSDTEFLPIQAADFFAWLHKNERKNPDDRRFDWLRARVNNVSGNGYSQIYDMERMASILKDRAELIETTEGVSDLLQQEYDKLFR